MLTARLAVAVVFLLSSVATANDTAVTLGGGGLVPLRSSSIVMESEDLEISVRRINVRYVFRNTSNRDEEVTVAFPLPALDGGAVANVPLEIPTRHPFNFVDFKVAADGVTVTPSVEVRAFSEDKEITRDLRTLGMPLSVLDPGLRERSHDSRLQTGRRSSVPNGWTVG